MARPNTEDDPRIGKLLSQLRADRKLAPIVGAYEKQAREPGRKFGKNGLKAKNGKLFALFTQGTLVLKLPKNRVAALVEEGVGELFDPGHGRLMKEWLAVTSAKASWVELAKEAFAFVAGGHSFSEAARGLRRGSASPRGRSTAAVGRR